MCMYVKIYKAYTMYVYYRLDMYVYMYIGL